MGKVSSISYPGLYLWFNSNDHKPPHFHVEYAAEWEARILFLEEEANMVDFVYGENIKSASSIIRKVCKEAASHRAELLEEWNAKVVDSSKRGGA